MERLSDIIIIGSAALTGIVLVVSILWAVSDPYSWHHWRETMRRPSPPDPTYRSTPAERAPDAPPKSRP